MSLASLFNLESTIDRMPFCLRVIFLPQPLIYELTLLALPVERRQEVKRCRSLSIARFAVSSGYSVLTGISPGSRGGQAKCHHPPLHSVCHDGRLQWISRSQFHAQLRPDDSAGPHRTTHSPAVSRDQAWRENWPSHQKAAVRSLCHNVQGSLVSHEIDIALTCSIQNSTSTLRRWKSQS